MYIPVVTQAEGGTSDKCSHVQGQDWDEERLSAFQVTVEQNGYKNNLKKINKKRKNLTCYCLCFFFKRPTLFPADSKPDHIE